MEYRTEIEKPFAVVAYYRDKNSKTGRTRVIHCESLWQAEITAVLIGNNAVRLDDNDGAAYKVAVFTLNIVIQDVPFESEITEEDIQNPKNLLSVPVTRGVIADLVDYQKVLVRGIGCPRKGQIVCAHANKKEWVRARIIDIYVDGVDEEQHPTIFVLERV